MKMKTTLLKFLNNEVSANACQIISVFLPASGRLSNSKIIQKIESRICNAKEFGAEQFFWLAYLSPVDLACYKL